MDAMGFGRPLDYTPLLAYPGTIAFQRGPWLRLIAHGLVLVTFVSAVIIFDGFVRVLGSAMIAVVASCIAIRIIEFVRHRGGAPQSVLAPDATTS